MIDLERLRYIAEAYKFELAAATGWGSEALDVAQDAFDSAFDPDGVLALLTEIEAAQR